MTDAPLDLAEVPLVAECSAVEDLPAFLATVRAEVDAGRWFAWLMPEPDAPPRTAFIIGAEGAAFRIRDDGARPIGLYADFGAAMVAGLRHARVIS